MKQLYFFLLITLFFTNKINAQFCPPVGFSTGSIVYFIYDSGTSLCGSRPGVITIGGSTFTLVSCTDTLSTYELDSGGSPVADISLFTADFGGAVGNCNYSDGTLPIDKIDIINKASLKIYPNPIKANNKLFIKFAINTTAKINIFNIEGKHVLNDLINNSNSKQLDLFNLKSGIYIVKIQTETTLINKKFVIN